MRNIIPEKKRTRVVLGVVGVVVVLVMGYAFYSWQTWRGYQTSYQSWQTTTKNSLRTELSLPVATAKERDQKLVRLQAITARLKSDEATICKGRPLMAWQAYFNQIKTLQRQCREMASKVDGLVAELTVATDYLKSEHAVGLLLTAMASQPAQSNEETWTQTAAAWRKLGEALPTTKTDAAFEPTKRVAITVVKGVDDAWSELLSAHVAKDKPRFVAATASLASHYGALTTITNENDSQLTLLDKRIAKAYTAAF